MGVIFSHSTIALRQSIEKEESQGWRDDLVVKNSWYSYCDLGSIPSTHIRRLATVTPVPLTLRPWSLSVSWDIRMHMVYINACRPHTYKLRIKEYC